LRKLGQMPGNCEAPILSHQLFSLRRTGYMGSLCEG
jgi:hypothetical protein